MTGYLVYLAAALHLVEHASRAVGYQAGGLLAPGKYVVR
jgi:hypothetical protein